MARQPRLSIADVVHLVSQSGHDGGAIVRDDADADRLLQGLREAAADAGVTLHAYALAEQRLLVLAVPDSATGISRMMQAVGRRYGAWFNRRHGRSGALWNGRFRSTLLEPGPVVLGALRLVDGWTAGGPARTWTSAAGRVGGRRDPAVVDPAEYWQLGNTPFEREAAYRRMLDDVGSSAQAQALLAALQGGRPCGSPAFVDALGRALSRSLAVRPRGRPRLQATEP